MSSRRPRPSPRDNEVLIAVAAAGINRPDTLQRQGLYPPPPGAPDILGLEVAGQGRRARRRGECALPSATRFWRWFPAGAMRNIARRMKAMRCRFLPAFRWSRRARSPRRSSPSGPMCSIAAACKAGETLLVHGGTSGIGTTAIALAKAFGARVDRDGGVGRQDGSLQAARRRFRHQLSHDGFCRSDACRHRWARRRCHPRHGRRRLCRAQLCGGGGRRPHRADRLPERTEGDARSAPADGQAPRPYRLDSAAALAGGKGRHRPRASRRGSGRCWRPGAAGR